MKYLNNSDEISPTSIAIEGAEEKVADVVREIVGWTGEATVKTISGGITNVLYKVDLHDAETDTTNSALVRIYGSNTEIMIDRKVENRVFADLSRQGFAPTYYGQFQTGRVEGYLNARNLTPEEMAIPSVSPLIANELCRMHNLTIEPTTPAMLWDKLDLWLKMAIEVKFDRGTEKDATLAKQQKALKLASVFKLQYKWYKNKMSEPNTVDPFLMDTVFSHNDILSGNVLVDKEEEEAGRLTHVTFIDYEYGGYNFRGFDFANHFCECAGFDFDIVNQYPNRDTRQRFVAEYAKRCGKQIRDIDDMVDGVDKFCLASDLWWGFWAVLQARHSPIDFDFMGYAHLRLASFLYHKAIYFNDPDSVLDFEDYKKMLA